MLIVWHIAKPKHSLLAIAARSDHFLLLPTLTAVRGGTDLFSSLIRSAARQIKTYKGQ